MRMPVFRDDPSLFLPGTKEYYLTEQLYSSRAVKIQIQGSCGNRSMLSNSQKRLSYTLHTPQGDDRQLSLRLITQSRLFSRLFFLWGCNPFGDLGFMHGSLRFSSLHSGRSSHKAVSFQSITFLEARAFSFFATPFNSNFSF